MSSYSSSSSSSSSSLLSSSILSTSKSPNWFLNQFSFKIPYDYYCKRNHGVIQTAFEKYIFSQLLVGQSESLRHQNGVEFNFQSICKHHTSLRREKGGLLTFWRIFWLINTKVRKILILGIMAHCEGEGAS